jgi:NADPH:quinone reductase-like Zn-dependent oxidoreductase
VSTSSSGKNVLLNLPDIARAEGKGYRHASDCAHEIRAPEVLQLKEVDKPLPEDHQLLIRVRAASANTLDLAMRGPFLARIITGGLRKPKNQRLGVDLAGRVEAVGSKVTRFRPGDEVFGTASGAFAEYVCAQEHAVALKPAATTFEAAAAVPVAALTALQGLRDKGQV